MALDITYILQEIDIALRGYDNLKNRAHNDDCSDLPEADRERVVARLAATIERFAPPSSYHARRCAEITQDPSHISVQMLPGVLQALRDDIANQRTASLVELVHAEIFSDFLDMAQHLLDAGFKDAAAVIAGSSLEAHLRALADKHGIALTETNGAPRKADRFNAELCTAGAYGPGSKTEAKNVVAWLGNRNDAAHGDYSKYDNLLVGLNIASIRAFMTRFPA